MTDLLHPTDIVPESAVFSDIDPSTQTFRPDSAPGAMQKNVPSAPTVQNVRLHYSKAGRSQLFQLQAFYKALRGRANSVWLWPFGRAIQGSFSAPELLTNNDFSNGTTGWSCVTGNLTVSNRVARTTSTIGATETDLYQTKTPTAYAAYALRTFLQDGAQSAGIVVGPFMNGGADASSYSTTLRGLRTIAAVGAGASGTYGAAMLSIGGAAFTAGAYSESPWMSLARCLLVDNGPNALLRSDEFDNAAWTKNKCTITANTGAAPDGTSTRDDLIEDNTSGQHYVTQNCSVSSAANDFCVCVAVRSGARSFFEIQIAELTGSHTLYQFFNLSTAAVGVTGGSTGANMTNRRAFARDLGNGWVLCCLIGRKTNAATSMAVYLMAATADSGAADSYLGTSVGAFSLWRATAAQSSVPVRLTQTTTTAIPSGTNQSGSALYMKSGRTPSEGALAGALLKGDFVEIVTPTGSELNALAANLDLDAAGLGYLQLVNPVRSSSIADNAAVIVNRPMGKFTLTAEPQIPELVTGMGEFDANFAEDWL